MLKKFKTDRKGKISGEKCRDRAFRFLYNSGCMTTTESIHKISLNELSPYVRLATFTDATKEDFFVPWRMIYDYEMYYLIEGEIVVRTRSQEVVLQPGDLHIMRPFIWHKREANTDRVKYYGVQF